VKGPRLFKHLTAYDLKGTKYSNFSLGHTNLYMAGPDSKRKRQTWWQTNGP
jgi:hypothetical protein